MSLLDVSGLSIHYGDTAVVSDVSFSVDSNESVGLVGESGSGKTQTALAILGLTSEQAGIEGSIRFDGAEIVEEYESAFAANERTLLAGANLAAGLAPSLAVHESLGREEILEVVG